MHGSVQATRRDSIRAALQVRNLLTGLRKRRLLLVGAAVSVAVVAAAFWIWSRPAAGGYVTEIIDRGPITRGVTATGTVNPVLTITVGSYVSGVIQSISCDYNTRVRKGQLCAQIDPRPYQTIVDQDRANLDSAMAQVAKDEANLTYTGANVSRYLSLYAAKATSKDARDSAVNDAAQARAQVALDRASVAQRQAALQSAQVNLGYTNIVSPVDGTVVSRNVTMGQTVAASFQTPTLFLIATDLTKMQVDTNVSESDIGAIQQGNTARFTVDAFPNRVFQGAVTQVRQSPQTVQNVVTFDVVISADNTDLALKPGMTASVQLITDQRTDALRVPDQALRYTPAGAVAGTQDRVWLLREGKPVAVPVVRGLDDDTNTEITQSDVKPGDQVIVGEQRGAATRAALPVPRM